MGAPMTTKLHINMSLGVLEVEGDPILVREIYDDFKEHLLNGIKIAPKAGVAGATVPASQASGESTQKVKSKRKAAPKKKSGADDDSNGISADQPKLDKNLDTSGLQTFYGGFEPKNHSEKILIFLKFMIETLGIDHPNTDQVFTCYKAVNEKMPQAFKQAFHTANTQHGYIDFKSSSDISIPIAGDNYFAHDIKKKASE
jgi:hypothetical protein